MLLSALWRFLLVLSARLLAAFLFGLSRCFVGLFGEIVSGLSQLFSLRVIALSERLPGGTMGLRRLFMMLGSFLMCFSRQDNSPLDVASFGRPLF